MLRFAVSIPLLVLLLVFSGEGLASNRAATATDPDSPRKQTVCTITVNSSDEKETFRQKLPADRYQFVELVERGRPDWLASACRQGIRCDLLVISGHFDGSTEFYSDQVSSEEFLPVEEMERASCSDSCPGLFSNLKEVYLFGCNTLNASAVKTTYSEVARSLERGGYSRSDAERRARFLDQRHGESSRDRMRRIFVNVPVIYGFSSVAPLGPTAAARLVRYFQSSGGTDVGAGRASPRLLSAFSAESMIAVNGLTDSEPRATYRREVCRFIDDRPPAAEKLDFIHELLRGDMSEARMFLDRIEAFFASLTGSERYSPTFVRALAAITQDTATRDRYLHFVDSADPQIRARMIQLASTIGWLTKDDVHAELMRMIGDLFAQGLGSAAEVDLVCSLNKDGDLDDDRYRLPPWEPSTSVSYSAALACLGSGEARERVLRALTSNSDADVQIAEVYVGFRPITDVNELRTIAGEIARMPPSPALVRALDTLARHRITDRESLMQLAGIFPVAESVDVQRAIAALVIRSDYRLLPTGEMVQVLTQSRLKSTTGDDIIDILIRRLQMP